MRKPYLIQRCMLREGKTDRNGIDKYFAMDYMGSSEFEWGALPKALKEVRENIKAYDIFQSNFKPKKHKGHIWIYCKRNDIEEVENLIKELSIKEDNDYGKFKELTYFHRSCSGEYKQDIVMWWDIDNNFFFAKEKSYIDNLIKGLFNQ